MPAATALQTPAMLEHSNTVSIFTPDLVDCVCSLRPVPIEAVPVEGDEGYGVLCTRVEIIGLDPNEIVETEDRVTRLNVRFKDMRDGEIDLAGVELSEELQALRDMGTDRHRRVEPSESPKKLRQTGADFFLGYAKPNPPLK